MTTMYRTMQDAGAMWEADAAAEWEMKNANDIPTWTNAEDKLAEAVSFLNKVESLLDMAAGYVDGSTESDRIASLAASVSELSDQVSAQKRRMKVM